MDNINTSNGKMKACKKCGIEKPATKEYFVNNKNCANGIEGTCKVCKKKYLKRYQQVNKNHIKNQRKQYYEKNKERLKQWQDNWRKENRERVLRTLKEYYYRNRESLLEENRQYYHENKDRFKESSKQWREENQEKIKVKLKRYYIENQDLIKQRSKEWHKKNKEYANQYSKSYYEKNKQDYYIRNQKRRATLNNLPNDLTKQQWNSCKRYFDYKCAYCGKKTDSLHQEHFIPLSKGGEFTRNNIIPACRNCNSSKYNNNFFEWYPTHKHYSKQREQKILKYLNYNQNKEQQLALL